MPEKCEENIYPETERWFEKPMAFPQDYFTQTVERPLPLAVVVGVTGAIGWACAYKFFSNFYRVVGISRTRPGSEQESYFWISSDVTADEYEKDLNQFVLLMHCVPSVVVYAAAVREAPDQSVEGSLEQWRQVLDVDLTGAFRTCRALVPAMKKNGGGSIILLSSFHAFGSYPERLAYATAKAGVVGLTQGLAVELGPFNIRVNAVAPGPVVSPRLAKTSKVYPDADAKMIARTPLGRLSTPEDVADLVYFLATAPMITGETILMDGGYSKDFYWGR